VYNKVMNTPSTIVRPSVILLQPPFCLSTTMQIKRKRRDGSSRRKNIIRIVLLLIGSIALIILFNIINEKDEFTSVGAYTKTDGGGEGTMLRGESSLNENINSAINKDQTQRQDVTSENTVIAEAQDIKQTQDVVDASNYMKLHCNPGWI